MAYADDEPEATASASAAEASAFRQAEKRYQLRRPPAGRRRRPVTPPDLSGAIDVDAAPALEALVAAGEVIALEAINSGFAPSARAFTFPARPGFVLIRDALPLAARRRLAADAFLAFPEPPAHTNFTRAHGGVLRGLFAAAQAGLRLDEEAAGAGGSVAAPWRAGGGGPAAAALLARLRWASVGPQFDWTARKYLRDGPYLPLPLYLSELATSLAAGAAAALAAAAAGGGLTPVAAAPAAAFRPDAALVNYYRAGDTLGGHIDNAEADLEQPLVALSLGCPGVLLVGGPTRAVPPTALLVRCGDACVFTGPARRAFHGVPRVLPGGAAAGAAALAAGAGAAFAPVAAALREARVSVSVRATAPGL
jgi:alkylated DNA repair protein alkB family protein 1